MTQRQLYTKICVVFMALFHARYFLQHKFHLNPIIRQTDRVYFFQADIEGVPEVSLNLFSKRNIHIAFHPCLQWIDITSKERTGSLGNSSPDFYQAVNQTPVSRSVCFTPPREMFPLCHMNGDSQLPVKGVYQFKTEVGWIS